MSDKSSVAARCVLFLGMAFLASCGGGSTDNSAAQTQTETASQGSPPSAASESSTRSSDDEAANVTKAEAIVKDQFFPDQVDRSDSAKYQREWYMVKGAVQQAGYPCAAVAYVQQTMEGTFKAVCKVALHTNKYDAFTIDPNAETVVPYR